MPTDLLNLAKSYFTTTIVEKMASANAEPAAATQKAIGGILPALLGGVLKKVSTDGNANWLMNLLQNGGFGSSMLANLEGMFTGSAAASSTETTGESLTRQLFGNQNDDVARGIATYAGVRKDAASGLMEMVAPVLMSVIGKQVADQNLGATGLMGMITGQADHITAALPAGLGALGGLLGLTGLGSAMSGTVPGMGSAMDNKGMAVAPAKGGLPGWLLPLLGGVALLALLWFLMRGCNNKPAGGSGMADSTMVKTEAKMDTVKSQMGAMGDSLAAGAATMGDSVKAKMEQAAGAVTDLGAFGKRKLPDGVELNIPANGVENKLIAFIEDASKPVDKTTWFSFDRLEFATGKSTLLPKSQAQLKDIAAILKAYPAVDLKLGGYTDNTGSKTSNLTLSAARAKTTMNELVSMGITKTRLESEGYGPEHPVAPNNTPEGRQRNRRIDVRVTKK